MNFYVDLEPMILFCFHAISTNYCGIYMLYIAAQRLTGALVLNLNILPVRIVDNIKVALSLLLSKFQNLGLVNYLAIADRALSLGVCK